MVELGKLGCGVEEIWSVTMRKRNECVELKIGDFVNPEGWELSASFLRALGKLSPIFSLYQNGEAHLTPYMLLCDLYLQCKSPSDREYVDLFFRVRHAFIQKNYSYVMLCELMQNRKLQSEIAPLHQNTDTVSVST